MAFGFLLEQCSFVAGKLCHVGPSSLNGKCVPPNVNIRSKVLLMNPQSTVTLTHSHYWVLYLEIQLVVVDSIQMHDYVGGVGIEREQKIY